MHQDVQRLEQLSHAPLHQEEQQEPVKESLDSQRDAGDQTNNGGKSARTDHTWPTLDRAALHGLPGQIVNAIAPHTEADRVALLVHLLSEFSCIIGWGSYVTLDGASNPLVFWPVCVGDTSKSRKGTASKRIKTVFREAVPWWTRGEYQGNLSSGEGLVNAVRDARGDDLGVPDKRLFLVQTEFGTVLKVMGREGNSLSGVIRDAWDGEDLAPMTKGNPIRATAPIIGIVGHVTQEELLRHLTQTEASNGFGNRFVWFAVRRAKCLPFGGLPDPSTMAPLIEALREAVEFASTAGEIGLTDEAARAWEEVYPDLSEGKPGMVGALLGRSEAQVRRSAALYALLDREKAVTVVHLKAALGLWQYAEDSVYWIFGRRTGDSMVERIVDGVRVKGELTDSEISGLFSNNVPAARLNPAKQAAERASLIHQVILSGTGGRNQRVWRPGRKPETRPSREPKALFRLFRFFRLRKPREA